jgi:hypothetical protein
MERCETDETFRQSVMLEVEDKTNALFSQKNLLLQLNTQHFPLRFLYFRIDVHPSRKRRAYIELKNLAWCTG